MAQRVPERDPGQLRPGEDSERRGHFADVADGDVPARTNSSSGHPYSLKTLPTRQVGNGQRKSSVACCRRIAIHVDRLRITGEHLDVVGLDQQVDHEGASGSAAGS